MTAITSDKYMQFVIEHFTEIQSLNELVEYTKSRLPTIIKDEIVAAILELEESYFKDKGLAVAHNKPYCEVWWYDPTIYNLETEEGPYFGFWYENLDWVFLDAIDPDHAADFYLLIDPGNVRGSRSQQAYIDQWIKLLQGENEKVLEKAGYLLWFNGDKFDYTNPCPVTYPLYKELRLEIIKDRDTFRQHIQKAVQSFTDTVLPLLRGPN